MNFLSYIKSLYDSTLVPFIYNERRKPYWRKLRRLKVYLMPSRKCSRIKFHR